MSYSVSHQWWYFSMFGLFPTLYFRNIQMGIVECWKAILRRHLPNTCLVSCPKKLKMLRELTLCILHFIWLNFLLLPLHQSNFTKSKMQITFFSSLFILPFRMHLQHKDLVLSFLLSFICLLFKAENCTLVNIKTISSKGIHKTLMCVCVWISYINE